GAQLAAQKLPRGGLGDLVHDLDLTRILVGGESLAAETDQVVPRDGSLEALLEGDERLDGLSAIRIRDAHDRRFPDARVLVQHVLDLSRPDLVARGDDQVFLSIDQVKPAARVPLAHVTRVKPAVANRVGGLLRLAPVAGHHHRPLDQALADRKSTRLNSSHVSISYG